MSSFKSSSLIVSQKATPVTPTISGDLSVVSRNGHLQVYDGSVEKQVVFSDEIVVDLSGYTPLTTTSAISAGLDSRITSNSLVDSQQANSINDIYYTYTNSATTSAISAGLNSRLASNELLDTQQTNSINTLFSTYANSSTVASISAGLDARITSNSTAALINSINDIYSTYANSTTVAAISAGLNTGVTADRNSINTLFSTYTNSATTSAISAGLNSRLASNELLDTQQTNSINTLYSTYTNSATTSAISAGLNTRINGINLTPLTNSINTLYSTYTNSATTSAISAGLNTRINGISSPTSATFLADYDVRYVNTGGDTMTGPLIVPGVSSPKTVDSNQRFGVGALNSISSGVENTAVGKDALYTTTTGGYNVAIGTVALYKNVDGQNNVAVGRYTLYENTSGYVNTAVGHASMASNTDGVYNTAVGGDALYGNTTGDDNTAVGYGALSAVSTGVYNTAIGDGAGTAGSSISTGSYNTMLGANSQVNSASSTYRTALGAGSACVNDSTIRCGRASTDTLRGYNYTADSDRRLKENIVDLPLGLDFVMTLRPVSYKWKDRTFPEVKDEEGNVIKEAQHLTYSRNHAGFIAQEIGSALKATGIDLGVYQDSGVAYGITEEQQIDMDNYKDPNDLKGYSVEQMLAIAVKAIQELKVSNDDLKRRLEVLENR